MYFITSTPNKSRIQYKKICLKYCLDDFNWQSTKAADMLANQLRIGLNQFVIKTDKNKSTYRDTFPLVM